MSFSRHWLRWLIGAVIVIAVVAVGGPFVYIHFISGKAPAQLSLATPAATSSGITGTTGTSGQVAGTWTAGSGSVVGYRVNEVLLGQHQTAVGRTQTVSGHLTVTDTALTAASFTVPMDTVHSNESQRDAQFDGRIMNVAQYPDATFTLTRLISLSPLPAADVVKTYTAHGSLTLHGQTRAVTFPLTAELTGGKIDVAGHILVTFADYGIENPSFGSFVTTQDYGILEFLLVFSKG
jgi:polyisoprenoid-binding protein YceI